MVLGEYTGKNGRKYKWEKGSSRSGWFVTEKEPVTGIWICSFSQPSTEDWPAAKAALDALIEAESEGWVEIDDNARIQRDGSDPQVRHEGGICCWRGLTNPIDKRWPKAYRKGREAAIDEITKDYNLSLNKILEHCGCVSEEELMSLYDYWQPRVEEAEAKTHKFRIIIQELTDMILKMPRMSTYYDDEHQWRNFRRWHKDIVATVERIKANL